MKPPISPILLLRFFGNRLHSIAFEGTLSQLHLALTMCKQASNAEPGTFVVVEAGDNGMTDDNHLLYNVLVGCEDGKTKTDLKELDHFESFGDGCDPFFYISLDQLKALFTKTARYK